jgi:hypothetical protein
MRVHQITGARTLSFALAAIGLLAVAAPASAAADVVKYNTRLTITKDGRHLFHGEVKSPSSQGQWRLSKFSKCMDGRRVVLFNKLPGADRKLGTDRSEFERGRGGVWWVDARRGGRHVYAKVRRQVHDEFVCSGDRVNYRR